MRPEIMVEPFVGKSRIESEDARHLPASLLNPSLGIAIRQELELGAAIQSNKNNNDNNCLMPNQLQLSSCRSP